MGVELATLRSHEIQRHFQKIDNKQGFTGIFNLNEKWKAQFQNYLLFLQVGVKFQNFCCL